MVEGGKVIHLLRLKLLDQRVDIGRIENLDTRRTWGGNRSDLIASDSQQRPTQCGELIEEKSTVLAVATDNDGAFHCGTISILGSGKIILPPRSMKAASRCSRFWRKCQGKTRK